MNKRKRKIDCRVMHLKNLTKSKQKSRKSNSKMLKKIAQTQSVFFPTRDFLLSSGDYV